MPTHRERGGERGRIEEEKRGVGRSGILRSIIFYFAGSSNLLNWILIAIVDLGMSVLPKYKN